MDVQQHHAGSRDRFGGGGTMRRPNPPARLPLSSPRSDLGSSMAHIQNSLSPRKVSIPRTAPLADRGPPDLRVQPSSAATSAFPASSHTTDYSHLSTRSSYESFDSRLDRGGIERSGSAETVRGIAPAPRTPVDAATIDSESRSTQQSDASQTQPLCRRSAPTGPRERDYGSLIGTKAPSTAVSAAVQGATTGNRWLLSSIMHGVILALQSTVTLAVFSALAGVTVWQKSEASPEFWDWLWKVAQPALGAVALLCFATLLAHEVRGLSAVVLLYLQCGILFLTTGTVMLLGALCFAQESRAVKGVLVGCDVFMWGMAFLGFVRAAVVWKVENEREELASRYAVEALKLT